jgi:SAM-dependent methyltransferase
MPQNTPDQVREYWEMRYSKPDAHVPSQSHLFVSDFLSAASPPFLEELQGARSIIEIGCARGEACRELSDRFPADRILGVEISENAINSAKVESQRPNIEFRLVDILEDDLSGEKFDLAYCSNTLEHFVQAMDVLSRILFFAKKAIVLVPYKQPPEADVGIGGDGHAFYFDENVFDDRFVIEDWFTFYSKAWDWNGHKTQLAVLVSEVGR